MAKMIFTYSVWEGFCKSLAEKGLFSVTAKSLLKAALSGNNTLQSNRWVNLKHDVESSPEKALQLARIEAKYGHHATYYVQSYLMTEDNQSLFLEIQELGHEVTYHHDVMDGSKGDLEGALFIFANNLEKFNRLGFEVETVCQHGNPMSTFENRDFFRSEIICVRYPQMADIMVNFGDMIHQNYVYISDVGMSFKIVNDPVNSDKKSEDEKYMLLGTLDDVLNEIKANTETNYMISSHPHRYHSSFLKAWVKTTIFSIIRGIAKLLFKIPGLKKLLFRFNFISKKL